MREDEVVRCQMQGSFNLLAPANESDVIYLKTVSLVFRDDIKVKVTFAIRVLSISS